MSQSELLLDPSSASPPPSSASSPAESPSPPPNAGPYEWLRISDVIFAVFQGGVPSKASWSAASLMVYSFPDLDSVPQRSIWYIALEPRVSSGQNWYTIDLFDRPWSVVSEEASLTLIFDLGDVASGNGQRFLVKMGGHESYSRLLKQVCYIKGSVVGAVLDGGEEL